MLEQSQTRATERAQQTARRTREDVKEEVGRVAFKALEQYFPEEAKRRNSRNRLVPFLAGMVVGYLLHVANGR